MEVQLIPLFDRGKWLILALCVAAPCSLCAQERWFDATNLHGPTDLATGWLVHAGDDRAYARSDFDDASWTPFNAEKTTC